MKKALILPMLLLMLACNNSRKQSSETDADSLNVSGEKTAEVYIDIIKGWGNSICKDSIYTLNVTGDSSEFYHPLIGQGGMIYNKGNGNYEFELKNDTDTLSIMIIKKMAEKGSDAAREKLYKKFLIPVRKQK